MASNPDPVFAAIEFAARAHAGQYRKQTRLPYIIHPLAVARILIEAEQDGEVVVAGVLHDTLEDTEVGLEAIEREFGPRVAGLVSEVSEPDKGADWESRKQRTVDSIGRISLDAVLVECADKLDNIRAIEADFERLGDEVWERFNRPEAKQRWYYRALVRAFGARLDGGPGRRIFERLARAVERVFGPERAA
ncbi:MAG: bifunctional (p)ppGpp synthetase/guanosine-3',5'-bis(diphosphate) 3'-pyrophosphohydrolase [Deltaproteobacteria bacterium]|nr:bifunctional (p)ppGpp synthetase/guanosine-3',5'-bis(diphosphate) 3'-pyrophosphohydrolase [Deltaproteobacteria bacterium]